MNIFTLSSQTLKILPVSNQDTVHQALIQLCHQFDIGHFLFQFKLWNVTDSLVEILCSREYFQTN